MSNRKRCVMVMYDTLCRHFLPPYGNSWVKAPNFERLARRSTQFQNFYVGSMPCMPARRELHTGRYNFLHRSWGPLEPFDDSMPELLHSAGIHAHKVTDHQHYWEDGGGTYHQRYTTFDFVRGQEGDRWIADVEKLRDPSYGAERWPEVQQLPMGRQDNINREHMIRAELQPQHRTFDLGLEFLDRNHAADRWFLQIETFDPHEPFFTQQTFKDLYPHDYDGPPFDWPPYREVRENPAAVEHIRYEYAALITFCDQQLGRVLDAFDRYDLWADTLLIVNTDHGLLMGEHDWWAKVVTPFFQEIAHIPFWIYDPRHPEQIDQRRTALAQTIDLPPTLLDYFGLDIPRDMQGHSLRERLLNDQPTRTAVLYGVMGGQVNVTDGRYVYMRGNATDDNTPLFEYTLMPTHMNQRFSPRELQHWERHQGFSFSKGCPLMQIPARTPRPLRDRAHPMGRARTATLLFDLERDPGQQRPLLDTDIERRMVRLLLLQMDDNECPPEQFERLGLPASDRSAAAIARACMLNTAFGHHCATHAGAGRLDALTEGTAS